MTRCSPHKWRIPSRFDPDLVCETCGRELPLALIPAGHVPGIIANIAAGRPFAPVARLIADAIKTAAGGESDRTVAYPEDFAADEPCACCRDNLALDGQAPQ